VLVVRDRGAQCAGICWAMRRAMSLLWVRAAASRRVR
jgi:hypothetical protein